IDINMTATRNPKGFTAAVIISSSSAPSATVFDEPTKEAEKPAKEKVVKPKTTKKVVVDPEVAEKEQAAADDAEKEEVDDANSTDEEKLFG
nr:hypothetical protein [Bacteroidales bacterium]